ncbi:MAG: hypothetical protein Q9214_003440 [Letrouitia sp. 1 TL-2023]
MQFSKQVTEKNIELMSSTDMSKNPSPGKRHIIESWVSQGIWDSEWNSNHVPGHRWKHEHSKVTMIPEDASFEQMVIRAREIRDVDASRPINMFLYNWLEEVKKTIQGKGQKCTMESELTKMIENSYQVIKRKWKNHKKWTKEWGLLPGDQWRHETTPLGPEPKDEETTEVIDSNASTITESLG